MTPAMCRLQTRCIMLLSERWTNARRRSQANSFLVVVGCVCCLTPTLCSRVGGEGAAHVCDIQEGWCGKKDRKKERIMEAGMEESYKRMKEVRIGRTID